MKNKLINGRIIWTSGAFIALFISWIVCRFAFWDLHWNRDWLMILFIMGLVTLAISAIKDARKVMFCTVVGYIGGFALGILFSVDGVDAGGARTNNWWQIWTVLYIIMIIAGVFWEVIASHIKKQKR